MPPALVTSQSFSTELRTVANEYPSARNVGDIEAAFQARRKCCKRCAHLDYLADGVVEIDVTAALNDAHTGKGAIAVDADRHDHRVVH